MASWEQDGTLRHAGRRPFTDEEIAARPVRAELNTPAPASEPALIRERAGDGPDAPVVVWSADPEPEHSIPVSPDAQWRAWRRESMTIARGTETLDIGAVTDDFAGGYESRSGQPLQGRDISISRRVYHHLHADKHVVGALSETDLERLPEHLARPREVLYDTKRGERPVKAGDLIYVFDGEDGRTGKIVVRPNYRQKRRKDGKREAITTNAVRTAGYVTDENLAESRYLPLESDEE